MIRENQRFRNHQASGGVADTVPWNSDQKELGVTTRLQDLLWTGLLTLILCLLAIPAGFDLFVELSETHMYLMAFAKFSVLATMGELLAIRISSGYWHRPTGLVWRAVVWGLLGVLIALVFYLYAAGVAGALASGILPSPGGQGWTARFVYALFTSILMNLLFAPTFMAFHRVTDTYIELGNGRLRTISQKKLSDVLERIDWNNFISFVVCKTIPLFWIPAHTITFMLPPEHRVLAAAFLSIALGAILASARPAVPESSRSN